ncbi:MAG: hypothetical protein ACP5E9_00410 [Candidatus Methanospirareceae archaeon]
MSMESLEHAKRVVDYPKYLKRLLISLALALLTLFIAFGLMFFALEDRTIPGAFILLVFALFFIIFTVFYESKARSTSKVKGRGKTKEGNQLGEGLKPLIRGVFLGICATFALVTVFGGLLFTLERGFALIGGELSFISALAVAMIISMVYLSLLRPSSTS